MTEKKIEITGMSCEHCVKAVNKELEKLNLNSYDVEIGLATISYEETVVEESEIINAIEEAGYEVAGW